MTSKTTTTFEYTVADFNQMVCETFFQGKKAKVEFVIREVGGDIMDRHPGTPTVVAVKVTFDGLPQTQTTI